MQKNNSYNENNSDQSVLKLCSCCKYVVISIQSGGVCVTLKRCLLCFISVFLIKVVSCQCSTLHVEIVKVLSLLNGEGAEANTRQQAVFLESVQGGQRTKGISVWP